MPVYLGTVDYDQYECDVSNIGINFVFDTNLSRNSLFNYRLNAGYMGSLDIYISDQLDTTPDDYTIHAGLNKLFFLKLSVLFRINETYDDSF